VLKTIVEQGEKRLEAQCTFADAQDERGGGLVNAAAALAAASVALAAGAASVKGLNDPLTTGAAVGTIGFTAAAAIALWGLRSTSFHSCGWFPNDFAQDIRDRRGEKDLLADFALELQHRLSENKTALDKRGDFYNAGTIALLVTPVVALLLAFLSA